MDKENTSPLAPIHLLKPDSINCSVSSYSFQNGNCHSFSSKYIMDFSWKRTMITSTTLHPLLGSFERKLLLLKQQVLLNVLYVAQMVSEYISCQGSIKVLFQRCNNWSNSWKKICPHRCTTSPFMTKY